MSQYNDNVTTTASNQDDHDAHPSLMHKIANKLGIHSSHTKDGQKNSTKDSNHSDNMHGDPSNQASHLHDSDPNRVHDKDTQPGVVHKKADKGGIHSVHTDTMNTTEHHTGKVEDAMAAHGLPVGDIGGYPIYATDNDPHHSTTTQMGNKDSYGMSTDAQKAMDHHKKPEEAHLYGTTTNPHSQNNMRAANTTSTNFTTGQAPNGTHMSGGPSSTQHGGGDHDNIGAVNASSTNYTTTQAHTTSKEDSPGFKEKIKSKLGLSSDHQKTNSQTSYDNSGDSNTASRGFGASQPLSHGQQTDDSSSVLPRMTPQAEVGSVYSSSLLDNNQGNTMTDNNNRQGYSTTTTRDTTGQSGRTY